MLLSKIPHALNVKFTNFNFWQDCGKDWWIRIVYVCVYRNTLYNQQCTLSFG